ncbi:NACHT domain-containing protein [Streptomyces sp. NPDC004609]|uniref:NACHT domain-containing protein n=1 Tax=Streptomyces sp. NPDC004609 TaxID=3364704 RepID=UPI0036C2FD80
MTGVSFLWSRRRMIRNLLLICAAVVFVGLAVWMVTGDAGANDVRASVAGLFLGLVSLALALADFFRQDVPRPDPAALADDLAGILTEQLTEEARARRLRDPRVLPLAWAATARNVAASPASVARGAPGRVVGVRLDGRLDGRFEDVIHRLANSYGRLPTRRLVVLGEPGAGKTVLALLLTLGLLTTREAGGPVPVLLPVSSWDPVREPLDRWIVRTVAATQYSGRPEIPHRLLAQGLLLPVLDGLDEIPESARRPAVRAINEAIGQERPIVVTCRAAEYEDLIRGGAPRLRQAPVVEVSPVPAEDLIAYLRDLDWPDGVTWEPVLDRIRAAPDGPVAAALSTPLMVSSARLVYQHGGDPAELLDTTVFDCRYAVEDHLINRLVDAAYASDPARTGGRWDAARARRWLAFLARYLHDHRERDLAWWRMSQRLMPSWAAPGFALSLGAVLTTALSVSLALTNPSFRESFVLLGILSFTAFAGIGVAILVLIVWYASVGRPPGRLSLSRHGSWARLRRGFRTGVGLTLICGAPVLMGIVTIPVMAPWTFEFIVLYCRTLALCTAVAVVVSLALAVHSWLDAPPTGAVQTGPLRSLAQDRRSSLIGALAAGLTIGATGLAGWTAGTFTGSLIGQALTGWPGWPGRFDLPVLWEHHWNGVFSAFDRNIVSLLGLAVLLPAMVFSLLVLLTRAWPRFVVLRMILAVRGQLPWRLMRFLADARERELLRQSGGAYQFRHIRLQEALAAKPPAHPPPGGRVTPGSARGPASRRLILSAGAAASLTMVAVVAKSLPRNTARAALSDHIAPVVDLAFQHRGPLLASAGWDGTVRLWDTRTRRAYDTFQLSSVSPDEFPDITLAFHGGDRVLAIGTADGTVELWDISAPRRIKRLTSTPELGGVEVLAFHPKGHTLAIGYIGGETSTEVVDAEAQTAGVVRLWQWEAGTHNVLPVFAEDADEYISGMAFSPADGHSLVIGRSEYARVWDGKEIRRLDLPDRRAQEIPEMYTGSGNRLTVFNQDGSLLAFAPDGLLALRTTDTGRWVTLPPVPVEHLAFSPNGRTLALVGEDDNAVRLWDITTRRTFRTLTGHTEAVKALAFSPSGGLLASAGDDHTVRLWDTSTT